MSSGGQDFDEATYLQAVAAWRRSLYKPTFMLGGAIAFLLITGAAIQWAFYSATFWSWLLPKFAVLVIATTVGYVSGRSMRAHSRPVVGGFAPPSAKAPRFAWLGVPLGGLTSVALYFLLRLSGVDSSFLLMLALGFFSSVLGLLASQLPWPSNLPVAAPPP